MSVSEAAQPMAVGFGGGDFEDPSVSRVLSFKDTKAAGARTKAKKATSEPASVGGRGKKPASTPKPISERRAKLFVDKMSEGGW